MQLSSDNSSDPGNHTNTSSVTGSSVSAVDPMKARVTDADDAYLASTTAFVASRSAHDVLNATGLGDVLVSGNGTNTLILSGASSPADQQATLRTATCTNTTGDQGAGVCGSGRVELNLGRHGHSISMLGSAHHSHS